MHQWMGNLFYRGAIPSEIEGMSFGSIHYWNDWHNLMRRAEEDAARKLKGK
jgi:hypothetical protein